MERMLHLVASEKSGFAAQRLRRAISTILKPTPQAFVDGWLRSGDLGSKDADGYLFVRGRLKKIINSGGEKISPGEIDAVLLSNRKVIEAALFGESDAIYGENVQAAVIVRPGMEPTEGELRDCCRTKLIAFEVPERIYIVADFPRTAKGATDRHALSAQFYAGEDNRSPEPQ
jgi:oxalate---CoA ligase